MKILWISFDDMVTQAIMGSLQFLGEHDIHYHWYNKNGFPSDPKIMEAVERIKPDLSIYFGMAGGHMIPQPNTLKKIREKCRLVHFLGDASDPDWWPLLQLYASESIFNTTVNIDGNSNWPAGEFDVTALTPHDPSYYDHQAPLKHRPIDFGFCGGFASRSRADIILHLVQNAGLRINPRDERFGTYAVYANFMKSCKIVPNVPFSGSDQSRQVKGRVMECGLAGCVLLDHESSMARQWFTPGQDYVTYSSPEHAVQQFVRLTNEPEKMQEIASNLQRKVREQHPPRIFWDRVMERAMR